MPYVPRALAATVVDLDGRTYGIEVKATRTPTSRHANHLAEWCGLTGARGILACRIDLGRGIRATPWHFCVRGPTPEAAGESRP